MTILSRLGKYLFYLLIVAVLSGIVYFNRANYGIAYEEIAYHIGLSKPCGKPLYYSVQSIDERFGISREKLQAILSEAAGTWNKAADRELLALKSDGKLKISLIYDSRQQATNIQNNIGSDIAQNQKNFDSLKKRYDTLKAEYMKEKTRLESEISAYEYSRSQYEQAVSYWNSRGGAPGKELAILEEQRRTLNDEATKINLANQSLNKTVSDLNSLASNLNSLGKEINGDISTYNTVGESNGREFQEGEYIRDRTGIRINIYEYRDYDKLRRVLIHEFGHALGLDHVDDPQAIMYTYNSGDNQSLTTNDFAELGRICQI